MRDLIRSMAILKPHAGKEPDLLAYLREFYNMMHSKHYSIDTIFRDAKQPGLLVHIRIWASTDARDSAMQDPDVHRYWIGMSELATITTIYEALEPIFSTQEGIAEDILEDGI